MKRWLIGLFMLLATASPAAAQIVGSLPFNLQNNTVADASQVMANFNAIVSAINQSAANAGTNTNILRLSALSTPITKLQGGTNLYVATATGTGTGNAQVIAATSPTFTLTSGVIVQWVPVAGNTGPTTLNIAGTGLINVVIPQLGSFSTLSGGELVASSTMQVLYDGTNYVLLTPQNTSVPSGSTFWTVASSAPSGYLLMRGQAVSRTVYASLFSLIGTTYGAGDGLNTFNIPDGQGRYFASVDNGASRLNNCGSSGALASTCGGQTLAQSALPNVQLALSGTAAPKVGSSAAIAATSTQDSSANAPGNTGIASSNVHGALSIDLSSVKTVSLNGGVGQTSSVPPTIVLNAILKY